MHHFVRKPEEYKRRVYPLTAYQQQAAFYLQRHHPNDPPEKIRAFVKSLTDPNVGTHIKIPRARVLVRDKNGDRKMQILRFDEFLKDAIRQKRIVAPTLTVYENPEVETSMLGEYIIGNLNRRKKAKKEMLEADRAQNKILEAIKNAEQNTLKIKNNALSGAHSSPYTILFNKSSHSTLTSTCRTATSLGNANNEKFLCGNRHYYSPTIVRNNIAAICTNTDMSTVAAALEKYQLHVPTVDDVMEMIRRSTDPYWQDPVSTEALRVDVSTLTDVERAAIVYIGDFYHTAKHNPGFVRAFLQDMIFKPTEDLPPVETRAEIIRSLDSNTSAFVSILCAKEMNSRNMFDIPAADRDLGIIAATALNVQRALDKRYEFIRTFWVTDNMPSSVYYVPSIIRRGAIVSDTDSTIFTVQWWPKWYRGALDFTEESVAIANTLVFFSGETIRHLMAMYSANLGVSVKEIHRLSMKNEFYFPVFVLTSRAKHYFAYVAVKEGVVFPKMKTEIKGVALRSSNVPPAINRQAHALMRYIMDEVMAGRKVSLMRILRAVGKIEEGIRKDIYAGGFDLLPSTTIKTKEAYRNESSPYSHHDLWESAFAHKYGHAPQLPYVAIKVNLTSDNRSRYREWIASMDDREVAEKIDAWMTANGRTDLGVIMLPQEILAMHGIPAEIIPAANIRDLVSNTMTPFYLMLESFGYFVRNKQNTRLVMDETELLRDDWPYPEIDLMTY